MPPARKPPRKGVPGCRRAVKLLDEKVMDVLESLLDADDDKVRLAAAKEIKEIARQVPDEEPDAQARQPGRVFLVTGIDRKPGE
ncbi:hypothetical protein NNJEOMEG_01376 [Fundidesulfovibrio magnetotacticus]|uniref:HEAT repeat domain-containing protein n=1 Tax=Fundidesulfovibrio magnetotacticus TaxID=2730080 RepID=A0A6V8LLK3_9BACT|nr:hypothetical protein [Fundidesulfovibrio magnetotacticus]GFK93542.1 hypothetical protein NNJEOMEG_01376 [Fundidesulfovibrio magnetotacticus]